MLKLNNSLVEKAFRELYPDKNSDYECILNFSGRFKGFNANVRYRGERIEIKLSEKWEDVSEDFIIGVMQHLLMKVFKDNRETYYTKLYEDFIRNLGNYSVGESNNKILEESFERVNEKYLNNIMEKPNLELGGYAVRTLGSYDYHSDTIRISRILEDDGELLDFVMYHELLHKRESFVKREQKRVFHSKRFKELEKKFENYHRVKKRLDNKAKRYRKLYK